jgi:hypothetical protein
MFLHVFKKNCVTWNKHLLWKGVWPGVDNVAFGPTNERANQAANCLRANSTSILVGI